MLLVSYRPIASNTALRHLSPARQPLRPRDNFDTRLARHSGPDQEVRSGDRARADSIVCWGPVARRASSSTSTTRRGIVSAAARYCGARLSISDRTGDLDRRVDGLIAELTGFTGEIVWITRSRMEAASVLDTSRPSGSSASVRVPSSARARADDRVVRSTRRRGAEAAEPPQHPIVLTCRSTLDGGKTHTCPSMLRASRDGFPTPTLVRRLMSRR